MKTVEETKQAIKEKLITDVEYDIKYHTEKLDEAKIKLKAIQELK